LGREGKRRSKFINKLSNGIDTIYWRFFEFERNLEERAFVAWKPI